MARAERRVRCWMLNTLLSATGVRKTGNAPVDDFGDASLAGGVIDELHA